jgi:hypothetical protein
MRALWIAGALVVTSLATARPRISSVVHAKRPASPVSALPSSVPASEQEPGLELVPGRRYQVPVPVSVLGSAQPATPEGERDPNMVTLTSTTLRCLSTGVDAGSEPTLELPVSGVQPVRTERIVMRGRHAKLEILDLAVDTRTRGIRTLARTLLPLTHLAHSASDLSLYAYRQDGALYVVARSPGAMMSSGERFASSNCGLLVAPLRIGGESGSTLQVGATLQPPAKDPEARQRLVFALVSTSKTKRDREPVLSVALRPELAPRPMNGGVDQASPIMR